MTTGPRRRTFPAIASACLYALSLLLIGAGLWFCGKGDLRWVGVAVVGGLLWADLWMASKQRAAPAQKRSGK